MKRKSVRFLAGFLCSVMLLTSNGVYALADTADAPATVVEVVESEETVVSEEDKAQETETKKETSEAAKEDATEGETEKKATEEVTEETEKKATEEVTEETEKKATEEVTEETEKKETEEELTEGEKAETDKKTEVKEDGKVDPSKKEETLKDNELKKETEELEEVPEEEVSLEVDMRTFSDEFGYSFEYNAAASYKYTVDDGVLTAITNADDSAVEGNVVLSAEEGITKIGSSAFAGNNKITYLVIPTGVTEIAAGAFKNCAKLQGVYMPNSIVTIGDSAFEGCSSLLQISLPRELTSIGNNAFKGDSKLHMVYASELDINLETIGDYAFYGCTSLNRFCSDVDFLFPEKLSSVGAYAFAECSAIPKILIRDISLGTNVFENCSSLKIVSLSTEVTSIPAYAFSGCSALKSVEVNADKMKLESVGAYAFYKCYNLAIIELGLHISEIGAHAFDECTSLKTAYIRVADVSIGSDAFVNTNADMPLYLYTISSSGDVANYSMLNDNIEFVDYTHDDTPATKKYKYSYSVNVGDPAKYKISLSDLNTGKDVNTLGGVVAGTTVNAIIEAIPEGYDVDPESSFTCNGQVYTLYMHPNLKKYIARFPMPKRDAVLQCEFVAKDTNPRIDGTKFTVTFSNGKVEDFGDKTVSLKIGESSRIILIDENGKAIPENKITFTYQKNTDSAFASVDSTGLIKALRKGACKINAKVKGVDGIDITETIVVDVVESQICDMKIVVEPGYDESLISLDDTEDGIPRATMRRIDLAKATTFKLRVVGYDEEGSSIAAPLAWSSSDPKVAQVLNGTTVAGNMVNTITVPARANGEATITVIAAVDAKTRLKKQFIIRAADLRPRISVFTPMINPYMEPYRVVKVMESYGAKVLEPEKLQLVNTTDFKLQYDRTDETEHVHYYYLVAARNSVDKGFYLEEIRGKTDIGGSFYLSFYANCTPEIPNPTTSLVTKKKADLRFKDTGLDTKVSVTNLGTAVVKEFSLEDRATDKEHLFTSNFQIDPATGEITQKSSELPTNKAALNGVVVMTFVGYKSTVKVKKNIVIPSEVSAFKVKLSSTAGTFMTGSTDQDVYLSVLDAKNQPVELTSDYDIDVLAGSSVGSEAVTISGGKIKIHLDNVSANIGTVKMKLTNSNWADNQAVTGLNYVIKCNNTAPTASLTKTSIKLNALSNDIEGEFGLKSNKADTVFDDDQTFVAQSTTRNEAEYAKLDVTYEYGIGKVQIKDSSIKAGTYKFSCEVRRWDDATDSYVKGNKVTLSVVVNNTKPKMTPQGAASLNANAKVDGAYTEKYVLKLTETNIPEGYVLDTTSTAGSITYMGASCDWLDVSIDYDSTLKMNCMSVKLKDGTQPPALKTYAISITPTYKNGDNSIRIDANTVKFNVKVYGGPVSIKMTPSGFINLVDRIRPEDAIAAFNAEKPVMLFRSNNSIAYNPKLQNLNDEIVGVKIYDVIDGKQPAADAPESELFSATYLNKKIYVTPKINDDGSYAEMMTDTPYKVVMRIELKNYAEEVSTAILTITPKQIILPLTNDSVLLHVFDANKSHTISFTIYPRRRPYGVLENPHFREDRDPKNVESFDISYITNDDGSITVTLKLKDTVTYPAGSQNNIVVYCDYKGQGTNTPDEQYAFAKVRFEY